jgi:hypothetical protein
VTANPSRSATSRATGRYLHSRWPEWVTFSFYTALVALAIPFHEPWVDEAQAWQLARSLSLPELFKTYIRYEGSPGLWHFFLWVLIRLHISYTGLHWICGAIAVASTALLVFASPLPRYLKLTLPFTYFLVFQFAVVARSYVLAPLLFFIVAYFWASRPLIVTLALGLLANTSLHTAALSGGLATVYAIEQLRSGSLKNAPHRRKLLLGSIILVALYAFAIWTAWPPHDLPLSRMRGESRGILAHSISSLVWGMCEPWALSFLFWIVVIAWFVARRKFLYLLPVLFFALFSGEVFVNWWHVGLLIPALVALVWITWPERGAASSRFEFAGRFALLFVIGTHLLWSAHALVFDHYHAYSPDAAAANFLRPYVQNGDRIAVTYIDDQDNDAYDGTGLLPYFDQDIFVNQPYTFWWWSGDDPTEARFNTMLPTHPRLVLVEVRYKTPPDQLNLKNPRYESIEQAGYRFSRVFCGTFPERLNLGLTLCHVVFEYAGPQPAAPDPVAVPMSH